MIESKKPFRFPAVLLLVLLLSLPAILLAGSAKLHIDVGLNHFYKKRFLEAFQEFKAASELEPRNAEAHYNLGRVYRLQGFYREAAAEFEMAIAFDPRHASAQRELSEIKQFVQSDPNARQKLEGQEEALRQRFSDKAATPAQKRAEEFLKKGDFSRAIPEFEEALKIDAYNPKIYKVLGYLYFRVNRFSESLNAYGQARKLAPNDAEIPYSIGMIHLRTQNAQEALSQMKQAIDLSPGMIKAQFGLGEVYETLGQFEDALFQYRKCLQSDANLSQAQEKIKSLASRLSFNYFSRGSYYYKEGDYDKAEALLTLAKQYGSLSGPQMGEAEEMLTSSRYWIGKKRAEDRDRQERKEIKELSYINKNITVDDVARNPAGYVGQSVEWTGWGVCSELDRGKPRVYVNANSSVSSDSNLDYSFGIQFPKELPNDPRVSDYSRVEVKGKVIGVEKILNTLTNLFSSRKQPIVEATEVTFTREEYSEPLVLRYY